MMWGYNLLVSLFLILKFLTAHEAASAAAPAEPARIPVTLEVFTHEGYPHCEDAKQFLEALQREQPEVQIVLHDIWQDSTALERLRVLAAQRGIETPGVPAFYLQSELIIGHVGPDITGARLRALVDQPRPSRLE